MALIKVGEAAPDFNLLNQHSKSISLSEFFGKKNIVLYFYPKAMTPGCTVQACGIRDSSDDFRELDTIVMGISPDNHSRLARFKEKQKLNFDLLSDEDHSVTESYGCWDMKKFMGKEYIGVLRSTFIIDKKGFVVHVIDKVNTKKHHQDVLSWVKENLL
ncbi:MAG: thioredoxin-dependent thiol peroxidase [Gammaproteobacteria bacterium]|jgi:peroxiredoxin Q/BCP|nr:thioredoxin-dependent thiol peroxidase [Gammaproteobacteria bacterium]MDA7737295.1 thioredoxin-dependent thiol peroxidase [Porticoccus sp.]MDC0412575.1 thioredoxin-dependent thiol peroxidase [Porticoccus sp.]MDC0887611.1 thioredoxin-dependent thiol peroxidase [Porticoccus sp.]